MSTFKQIKSERYWVCDDGSAVLNTNYRGTGKTVPVKMFVQDGYRRLTLDGKHYLMSNLVAEAFLQKVEGKDQVDHRNGKRDDDRVENLRYCTAKENSNFEPRIINMRNRRYSLSDEAKEHMSLLAHNRFHKGMVGLFNENGELIEKYETVKIAAKENGVCVKTVRNSINGKIPLTRNGKYFKIID